MLEKVKNGITELVFILNRSGSMSGVESAFYANPELAATLAGLIGTAKK